MPRKLILVVALISAVGFGFGRITEEMCTLGGSYADDPSTPVAAAEFALPSHSQAAPKAFIPSIIAGAASDTAIRVGSSGTVPEAHKADVSSLQNPRRC